MKHRPTTAVLDAHLRAAREASIDEDLRRNFSPDLVLLTADGAFGGHDGLRRLNRKLQRELPEATYTYHAQVVKGEVALLVWSVRSERGRTRVRDGADTYVVREGRIVAQTIHYTVEPLPPDGSSS